MSKSRATMKHAYTVAASVLAALTLAFSAAVSSAQEGEIVAERGYAGLSEPWLVWDQASCSFKPTDDHPDRYSAELRKAGADGPAIVYTTADTILPVQKTINGSYLKYAELSGANMTMLSNEYPSKTKPILLAKQVAAMKPDVIHLCHLDSATLPSGRQDLP